MMKKTLCYIVAIFALIIFPMSTIAESTVYDLTILSYSELEALFSAVETEMKSRPEWKGVRVPAGTWTVGVDIPAGEYSITMCNSDQTGRVSIWGKAVNDYVTNGGCVYPLVFGYEYSVYGKCILQDGYIVESTIDTFFCPPVKLGF